MNNWHIEIADCNEAQKKVLRRVYGYRPVASEYLSYVNGAIALTCTTYGELITPEQAFERLGLKSLLIEYTPIAKPFKLHSYSFEGEPLILAQPASEVMNDVKEDLKNANQKIKELEQQLAAKPELQRINWSKAPEGAIVLCQNEQETLWLNKLGQWYDEIDHTWNQQHPKKVYSVIATRPKPKYTPEQIQAVKAYDEWLDLNSGDFESDCFEAWLKEVGNE